MIERIKMTSIADSLGREFCESHMELGLNWNQIKSVSEGVDGALETLVENMRSFPTDFDELVPMLDLICAIHGDEDCAAIVEKFASQY